MVNVQSKMFLKCNKSEKVMSIDIERTSPKQEGENYYEKKKNFKVTYCESCNEAWEPASSGSGMQHYPDFPMMRKLEHKECPLCVREKKREENKAKREAAVREAAYLITHYREEEAI